MSEENKFSFENKEYRQTYWHTCSHVLAQAMKRLHPDVKLAIGPSIDNGFYYDFDTPAPFTPEDLAALEGEMRKICKEKLKLERFELPRAEAVKFMEEKEEPYKVELINDLPEDAVISFYKQGDFTDLCAGPHLDSTGRIKGNAIKLTSATGAYWRGDSNRKMLQRIYGIAFPKKEELDAYLEQQAEALKEKFATERPAPEETLSFYVAECLEFTFAGEFHDHLTMEEALEAYDKIPSERMNADKCIGFCIEEDGGFVGMYELVVNDKVQRENINSINYFRDDKLVQQAISDMEKLMAARQQSKEQERSSTKKSVLDALRSLKAKKQEQPAQEQDKPKKAKKKGMEL